MTDQMNIAEFVDDPMGVLNRARAESWVVEAGPVGGLVVTYDDVRELLSESRLKINFVDFLETFGVNSGRFYDWMNISPLNHDGDYHRTWRQVMKATFTPKSVEAIRPYLQSAAGELIDGFADSGECDFIEVYADAYPSLGLCELIGVPHKDRVQFRQWANVIGAGFNPQGMVERIDEIDAATESLLTYSADLVEKRRAKPEDDLVSRIAMAQKEGADISDELIVGSIAGLVFAGHETTRNQLGWNIWSLSDRPDIWDAIGSGDLAARDVVDELLRFRSTVSAVGRRVDEAFEHKGIKLDEGQTLLLSLWGGDHDPAAYADPDAINVEKNDDGPLNLAFGHGPHHCLGAALARAELTESLAALTRRITCPQVQEGSVWTLPIGINGPQSLPITFEPRPRAS